MLDQNLNVFRNNVGQLINTSFIEIEDSSEGASLEESEGVSLKESEGPSPEESDGREFSTSDEGYTESEGAH